MRGTLNVILNEREGSVPVVRNTVRCHLQHQRRICHHEEKIQKIHLSNFTAKIISMSRIISI